MSQKLSDDARRHKNEYNSEYVRRNGGAAQRKWSELNKLRRKQKAFYLWLPQDADIIEHLESVNNFSDYIKSLIRADMSKS